MDVRCSDGALSPARSVRFGPRRRPVTLLVSKEFHFTNDHAMLRTQFVLPERQQYLLQCASIFVLLVCVSELIEI